MQQSEPVVPVHAAAIGAIAAVDEVIGLLQHCELPVVDVSPASAVQFFGARHDGALVAVVGLELYPPYGLLRSLAVAAAWRSRGLGRALVCFAEAYAARHGVDRLFLLTTTAERWFAALGYAPVERNEAPLPIRQTRQFAELCPSSSAFMRKDVPRPR